MRAAPSGRSQLGWMKCERLTCLYEKGREDGDKDARRCRPIGCKRGTSTSSPGRVQVTGSQELSNNLVNHRSWTLCGMSPSTCVGFSPHPFAASIRPLEGGRRGRDPRPANDPNSAVSGDVMIGHESVYAPPVG